MAESKANEKDVRTDRGQALARRDRENRELQRWDTTLASPFEFMNRMSDEMDRWFDRVSHEMGFPRRSRLSQGFLGTPAGAGVWSPRIEAFHKGDRFIVRADLPGLKKDEVEVELTDDALTIRGDRQEEHEEERGGYYHTERQYGEFYRTIPLPEGVIGESAQATFRDGVLEISMQAAPAEASRGRRLEIRDVSGETKK